MWSCDMNNKVCHHSDYARAVATHLRFTIERDITASFSLSKPARRASSSLTVSKSARSECAFSSTI